MPFEAIGNLVANLALDSKGFDKGTRGSIGSLKSFKSAALGIAGGIGVGLVAGFAFDKIADGFRLLVDVGRQGLADAKVQLDAEKKLAQALRSTGHAAGLTSREIRDYASELQNLTNFGDEETLTAASQLGTFTNIRTDVFKETLGLAQDISVLLGQDMKAGVIQLGKALNDPIKGVSALADVGVSFTEQQKEQIRNYQEMGDLVAAQRVILDELQKEFGGQAKALADPAVQLKNTLGDVSELVGVALMPSVEIIAKDLGEWTSDLASARVEAEAIGIVLADWVERLAVVPTIAGAFTAFRIGAGVQLGVTEELEKARQQVRERIAAEEALERQQVAVAEAQARRQAAEEAAASARRQWAEHIRPFTEEMEKLQEEMALMSGQTTELDLKLREFRDLGIDERQLNHYRALVEQQERLKAAIDEAAAAERRQQEIQRKLVDEGQRLVEESRTPAQKFRQEFAKLQELLRRRLIDRQAFQFGLEEAKSEFRDATLPDEGPDLGVEQFDFGLSGLQEQFLQLQSRGGGTPEERSAKELGEIKQQQALEVAIMRDVLRVLNQRLSTPQPRQFFGQ